jgi:transcriptional regulator of arginine metabolism
MPRNYTEQQARHETIKHILNEHNISSQSELIKMLKALSFSVTQSSISRDLAELAISKYEGFYRANTKNITNNTAEINEIKEYIKAINHAGPNILLLKTAIGAAQRVAAIIDRLNLHEVIGTISGDDTIFIATRNFTDQKIISNCLEIN